MINSIATSLPLSQPSTSESAPLAFCNSQQFCDEVLIRTANEGWLRPSIVISVFVGWKVSVTSFEVGARVYTIGPRGSVVASDHAMSSCELRVTSRSSRDQRGLGQRRRSSRVPVQRCQQPDRPQRPFLEHGCQSVVGCGDVS